MQHSVAHTAAVRLLRERSRSAAAARSLSLPRGAQLQPRAEARPSFPGRYGRWELTDEDVLEVRAYRASVTAFALAFDTAACASLAPVPQALRDQLLDPAVYAGAASLVVALTLVHMYIDVIKKSMQAMAGVGVAGAVGISLTQHVPVALFVHEHPASVWLVGPFFAALTGLCFKEGACYGKLESWALFFAVPALLLSRLFDAPDAVEAALLVLNASLLTVWAARKWTQEVKDDIGDKSVFLFRAMPQEEQDRLEARLSLEEEQS